MLVGGLVLHAVSLGAGEFPSADVLGPVSIGALLYLGVFATAIAFMIYFSILEEHGAFEAALIGYLVPIVATIASVFLLGEGNRRPDGRWLRAGRGRLRPAQAPRDRRGGRVLDRCQQSLSSTIATTAGQPMGNSSRVRTDSVPSAGIDTLFSAPRRCLGMTHEIAVIPGDGIGQEVTPAAVEVPGGPRDRLRVRRRRCGRRGKGGDRRGAAPGDLRPRGVGGRDVVRRGRRDGRGRHSAASDGGRPVRQRSARESVSGDRRRPPRDGPDLPPGEHRGRLRGSRGSTDARRLDAHPRRHGVGPERLRRVRLRLRRRRRPRRLLDRPQGQRHARDGRSLPRHRQIGRRRERRRDRSGTDGRLRDAGSVSTPNSSTWSSARTSRATYSDLAAGLVGGPACPRPTSAPIARCSNPSTAPHQISPARESRTPPRRSFPPPCCSSTSATTRRATPFTRPSKRRSPTGRGPRSGRGRLDR